MARVKLKLGKRNIRSNTERNSGKHGPAIMQARKALKGVSGNDVQEAARQHALAAIEALAGIVKSEDANDTAKIAAADTLLSRGYGKPTQTTVNTNVNTDGKPKELDSASLDQRIRDTLDRLEGATSRKRQKITSEERPVDIRKLN